jgi:hypothetical protein
MQRMLLTLATAATIGLTGAGVAAAASPYGCFKVTADELNIRSRPRSTAEVIGAAKKGDILEKRKWFCTLRGYWCAIRTKSGLEGYSDKAFMEKIPCP